MPAAVNHDCVPEELRNITVKVSTKEEILADKLTAWPAAYTRSETHLRRRDIWDIGWLVRQGTVLNKDWVVTKWDNDPRTGSIEEMKKMVGLVEEIATSPKFESEIGDMLPEETFSETLAQPGFAEDLGATCKELLAEVVETDPSPSPFEISFDLDPPSPYDEF